MNKTASQSHDKRCGTCAHADLARTPSGRFKREAGRCLFVASVPLQPWSVTHYFGYIPNLPRIAVWPDSGAGCPTWAPRP